MGCGSSHNSFRPDRRAYHGVAIAPAARHFSEANATTYGSASTAAGWGYAATTAGTLLGVASSAASQRQLRRQRIQEWRQATLGIVRNHGPQRPPPRTRYDHLTQFGTCRLGLVDELSSCTAVREAALSDGLTRSSGPSVPSSSCTSGSAASVVSAGLRLEAEMEASLAPSSEAAQRSPSQTTPCRGSGCISPWASHSLPAVPLTPAAVEPRCGLRGYAVEGCRSGHAHRVRCVTLVPQADMVLSCSTVDRHVTVYHTSLRCEVGRLVGHDEAVLAMAVSPDGHLVVTASRDASAMLWELPSCQQRRSLPHPAAVHGCRFSATGAEVATVCEDGRCRVWRWGESETVHALASAAAGNAGPLTAVAYSMDDREVLAGGVSGVVLVWDRQRFSDSPGGAAAVAEFCQHSSAVLALDASHTQRHVVMSADERSVLLWHCQTLAVLHRLEVAAVCQPRPSLQEKRGALAAAAPVAQQPYWTAVRMVDTHHGTFVVAASSDKCAHVLQVRQASAAQSGGGGGSVAEVLALPVSSSLSCVDGGPRSVIVLGDTCGNRRLLTLT